jgi:nucleoside-diphosphate-sugar epimerase
VRPSGNSSELEQVIKNFTDSSVEVFRGNLLSRDDCTLASREAAVVYHLAAGIEKSFSGSYLNSVVATRNLLESILEKGKLRRFVNISSFAVYSNFGMRRGSLLDETCQIEDGLIERYEPYVFAKRRQDDLVFEYAQKYKIPYVIVRPGAVYGPGKKAITARVGIDTFGIFLHLGGGNQIPLTYVDNCAQAIVFAGITKGVDGQIFNIVDDDLPTSRQFLELYKKNIGHFKSIYIPYRIFFLLCWMWEKYSKWSDGQLPPAFNRKRCSAYWKGNIYSNQKLKSLLSWKPTVSFEEGLEKYFEFCRANGKKND